MFIVLFFEVAPNIALPKRICQKFPCTGILRCKNYCGGQHKTKISMVPGVRIATTVILLSLTDALARGFRRAPPIKVQEEMGISPTLSIFSIGFFDPLNFATDKNFSTFREAELKHGRVCMMATIGMALSNYALFDSDVGDLALSKPAIHALTSTNAAEIIVVCAILETQVFVQRDPQDMPGDYGVGYFGTRDKARHER